MAKNYSCGICEDEQARTVDKVEDYETLVRICQDCPRCGQFWLERVHYERSQEIIVKLAAWIRERNMLKEIPKIDGDQIKRIATMPIPSLLERADLILIHIMRHQKSLNEVRINSLSPEIQEIQAISYSKDLDELGHLVK